MKTENLNTIEQLDAFLRGTQPVAFLLLGTQAQRYQWIQTTLVKFNYLALNKAEKGILRRYLMKVTGYSRAQLTRLLRQYKKNGQLCRQPRSTPQFARRYGDVDIGLLAHMDTLHDTPSGARLKKLCERADKVYGQTEYRRLAEISVAHLYNLRRSHAYRQRRRHLEKTRPKVTSIGERRKPVPDGQPGYLRIDTVHQGDLDGNKGVYHINAVDEVIQWEVVVSVEKISEAYLVPALRLLFDQFPFVILNFHSDNGSEYINHQVATLLDKLRIEFTKSRSRKTNDNALAEGKNAAIVRFYYGYEHIPQHFAPRLNEFNREYLNPYVNFHRPCFFPEIVTDKKGKQRKKYLYKNLMTPYEKLKSLPNAVQYLKPGMTFDILEAIAMRMSDNQAAQNLQDARQTLFNLIHEQGKKPA